MKKLIFVVLVLMVLSLPLMIIFGNALQTSFDVSGSLSSYLRYGKGDLSEFSEEEQEHLAEVKDLFQKVSIIFTISIVIFILSIIILFKFAQEKIKHAGTALIIGGLITLIALFVIYLLAKNWDSMFVLFHQMFFKTQWQFSSDSLLIKMFPEQFFHDVFKKIVWDSFFSAVGCAVLGVFLRFFPFSYKAGNK